MKEIDEAVKEAKRLTESVTGGVKDFLVDNFVPAIKEVLKQEIERNGKEREEEETDEEREEGQVVTKKNNNGSSNGKQDVEKSEEDEEEADVKTAESEDDNEEEESSGSAPSRRSSPEEDVEEKEDDSDAEESLESIDLEKLKRILGDEDEEYDNEYSEEDEEYKDENKKEEKSRREDETLYEIVDDETEDDEDYQLQNREYGEDYWEDTDDDWKDYYGNDDDKWFNEEKDSIDWDELDALSAEDEEESYRRFETERRHPRLSRRSTYTESDFDVDDEEIRRKIRKYDAYQDDFDDEEMFREQEDDEDYIPKRNRSLCEKKLSRLRLENYKLRSVNRKLLEGLNLIKRKLRNAVLVNEQYRYAQKLFALGPTERQKRVIIEQLSACEDKRSLRIVYESLRKMVERKQDVLPRSPSSSQKTNVLSSSGILHEGANQDADDAFLSEETRNRMLRVLRNAGVRIDVDNKSE